MKEPSALQQYQVDLKEKGYEETARGTCKHVVKSQRALAGPMVPFYCSGLPRFKFLIPQDLQNDLRGHHLQVQHGHKILKTHSLYKNSQAYIFTSQSSNTFRGPGSVCLATILFFVFYPPSQLPCQALGNQQDLPPIGLQSFLAHSKACYHQVCKILPSVVRS